MASFYPQAPSCQIKTLGEIYEKELGKLESGHFVDVGAHDGFYCSNTWGLAQIGWNGIAIEPMPELAAKARALYSDFPHVRVIEAAANREDGLVTLYTDGNPTINLETAEKGPWGPSYDLSHFLVVTGLTLNTILAENGFPERFEVLSIDVEGGEMHVLDGIDFKRWKPRLVILEVGKDHPIPSYRIHTDILEARMAAEGFREIYHDHINTIYVPMEGKNDSDDNK